MKTANENQNPKRMNLKSVAKRYVNFEFLNLIFKFARKRGGFTPLFGNTPRSWRRVVSGITLPRDVMPHGQRAGFTILEMVVALGIFSATMVASVGIMLGVSRASIKSTAVQAVIDNTRFSLELMTREMRTGTDFQIVNYGCLNQVADGIEFIDRNVPSGQPGKRRYYYLADLPPQGSPDTIMRVALTDESAIDCSLNIEHSFTAPEVAVEAMGFKLNGWENGADDGQPVVTVSLKIKSTDSRYQTDTAMNLQTTIVQRLLED